MYLKRVILFSNMWSMIRGRIGGLKELADSFFGVEENEFCGEGQKMEGASIRRRVLKILGLKREEGATLSITPLVAL